MLFNSSPADLIHEEVDYPENEAEEVEEYPEYHAHDSPTSSSREEEMEEKGEAEEGGKREREREQQVLASPLLMGTPIRRRSVVHSPAPRSPALSSPKFS